MSLWKQLVGRWGSGDGENDDVRIDASTNTLQTIEYEHHEIHANSHYFVTDFTTLAAAATLDFCLVIADDPAVLHMVFNFAATGLIQLDIYENTDFDADGNLAIQRANNRNKTFSGTHTGADDQATVMTDSTAAFTIDALIGWKIYNITDGSYGIITDNDATTVTVAALIGGTGQDWDTSDQYEINRSLTIVTSGNTINALGIRLGGQSGGDAANPNQGIPGGASRNNELLLRQNTNYLFRFTSGVNGNIVSFNGEWYEHEDKH